MQLRIGMTSDQVEKLFGPPLTTSAGTCGQAVGKPWTCITWYYSKDYEVPRYLMFSTQNNVLYLQSWNLPQD